MTFRIQRFHRCVWLDVPGTETEELSEAEITLYSMRDESNDRLRIAGERGSR